MSTVNTDVSAVLAGCIQAALHDAQAQAGRVVEHALDGLRRDIPRSPHPGERKQVEIAVKLLLRHQSQLAQLYPAQLQAEVERALQPSPLSGTDPAGALKFGELELMAEAQVAQSVEVARIQHAVRRAVQDRLVEFDALVCAARGLPSVTADRNPLRPDVYARALQQIVARFGLEPDTRLRWMLALGEGLGAELRRTYDELGRQLREQGVRAVDWRQGTATRSQSDVAVEDAAADSKAGAPAASGRAGPGLLTLGQLHRLLAGGGAQALQPEAPAHFAQTMPAALDALEDAQQVEDLVARMARRVTKPDAQGAGQLPLGWGAAISLEVVAIMVDAIVRDPRLVAPVRDQVKALEPALRRLALRDPRFFSDRAHPARRLLEALTERGLAWSSESEEGFASFLAPLERVVQALSQGEAVTDGFERGLVLLSQGWDARLQREGERRRRAVQALLEAERRNMLAEKIAQEFRSHPHAQAVHEGVLRFLRGPWAQVVAHAQLHDTSGVADPQGHRAMVGELLWSAQPQLASRNRNRLGRVVPGLLRQLKEGLQTINYPQSQLSGFFSLLMALHQQALLDGAAPAEPDAPLSREELQAQLDAGDDSPWVAPHEAQDSGLRGLDEVPAPSRAEQLAAVGPLQPGLWAEILASTGQWRRFQLTWCSPHGQMFMFTSPRGETLSMTRPVLDATVARGGLRVVSSQSMVVGALDKVAEVALRNSIDKTI